MQPVLAQKLDAFLGSLLVKGQICSDLLRTSLPEIQPSVPRSGVASGEIKKKKGHKKKIMERKRKEERRKKNLGMWECVAWGGRVCPGLQDPFL